MRGVNGLKRPVLIIAVQHLAAGLGHKDEVLNADAEFTGQVDARLNGKIMQGLATGRVGAADIALLVVGLADEMAQPVVEVFAVAGRRDQAAGGSVKVAGNRTPGLISASAASLARRTRSCTAACFSVGCPQNQVRVISLQ